MMRALRPGGVLILPGCTPKHLDYKTGGPWELPRLYTAELIGKSFKSLHTAERVEYEVGLNGTRSPPILRVNRLERLPMMWWRQLVW